MMRVAIAGIEWDVVDLVESCEHVTLAGFIDPNPSATVRDVPYLGPDASWAQIVSASHDLKVVLSMDDPRVREKLCALYGDAVLATVISPLARVSPRARLGPGVIVQHNVVVMPYAGIGRACKLNVGATVHHEAVLGDFVTLAPGAQVLGRVVIEDGVYVGAGSIIRQRCRVGRGAIVGAGAVVVRDVPSGITVVGVPANRKLV